MGLSDIYTKSIHHELDCYAAWEPTNRVKLGDYGNPNMYNFAFSEVGNITALGASITQEEEAPSDGHMEYSSSTSTAVNVAATGSGTYNGVSGTATVKIKFNKANAIYVLARKLGSLEIGNDNSVGKKVIQVYKQPGNAWKLSYAWVDRIITARQLIVIVSKVASTTVTFSGHIETQGGTLDPTDLSLDNLSISADSAKAVVFYEPHPTSLLTPFFHLKQVKDPIWSKPYVATQP